MELKQYFNIIWKRAWIPLLLLFVVAVVSLATRQTPSPTYTASMRFIVGVQAERLPNQFSYDGYYAGVSSEYIADDFSVVVGSEAFAKDVNRHLKEVGSTVQVPPGTIAGAVMTEKQHRILKLTLSWGNPDQLADIGQAIATTLEKDSPKYLSQLSTFGGVITMIDSPSTPAPVPMALTSRLELPVRLLLALGAGLALTFLLDYLDDSIKNRADLETLGINVLAEISK